MKKARKMSKQSVRVRRNIRVCLDCGKPWSRDPAPVVTDDVWKKIHCLPGDFICEPCLHDRFDFFLERPIQFRDLVKCPFNFGWARPCAKDDEPITFYDPYVARWLTRENKKFQTSGGQTPTKH